MTVLADWMQAEQIKDRQLAEKTGISRVHISRLRRGVYTPSKATAEKLAAATAIPAADFIFGGA